MPFRTWQTRIIAVTFISFTTILTFGCFRWSERSPIARLERSLVYQPAPYPSELETKKIPFENVDFESSDGTKLHGWFLDHEQPRAIALFCHGNAGSIASRGDALMVLNQRHGLAVMTFDYRGFGKSDGKPDEQGILADARAARKWLAERKGIPEDQILLMGRSLGGAVAVDLAASDGAKGLVLASTFTSLPDVVANRYRWLPARSIMTQRFSSLEKIKQYDGPLLQSHGDRDRLIPIEMGKQLFEAAPGQKQFVVIPGAGHNDPQSENYREVFDRFVDDLDTNR